MSGFVTILDNFGNLGALLLALGGLLFMLNKLRNDSKIDNVQGGLYAQLQDQLKDLRNEVKDCRVEMEQVYKERNGLKEQVTLLSTRVERLEECENLALLLKQRLAEKDATIAEKDLEIKQLMYEIVQLKDRLHHLELRLSQDEAQFCKDCKKI